METLMKMKWKIGSVEIENPFILAPMAGVTDLPFRILCKEQGAGLLCTEMVSAKAISFHNKNTISLMQIDPVEHPVSMQIFGSEPDLMAEVAKSIEEQPLPLLLVISAPMEASGVMIRFIGRVRMESSPSSSEINFCPARIPEIRRVVVPLLPTSSSASGAERP